VQIPRSSSTATVLSDIFQHSLLQACFPLLRSGHLEMTYTVSSGTIYHTIPATWNYLLRTVTDCSDTLGTFNSKLKTFLFRLTSFRQRLWSYECDLLLCPCPIGLGIKLAVVYLSFHLSVPYLTVSLPRTERRGKLKIDRKKPMTRMARDPI